MSEITHLHHVGHVVRDMPAARDVYRRLGFDCAPPAYPVLSRSPGAPATPFGAANTHALFPRNFVEIMTVVTADSHLPDDARPIPLQVPPAALAGVVATIERTISKISASMARFEGLHILVFATSDAGASAARFDLESVHHSGVSGAQRPGDSAPIRLVEIEDEDVPEGRLAVAESPPAADAPVEHPNGALDLVEATLCVADNEMDAVAARYARYVGNTARRDGATRVFDLQQSSLRLVPMSLLVDPPPALPAFVEYAVSVRDLEATRRVLVANGVPVERLSADAVVVAPRAALGARIVFRQV